MVDSRWFISAFERNSICQPDCREISRAGTKVGYSDPVVLYGRAIAQQIKGTAGITG